MNVWSDLTLAPEIKNRHLSGIYNFWSFCEVPIDRHTHSCNIFQQKVIGFNVRNFSRRKSKNNNATTERKRTQRRVEGLTANHIQDDINAFTAGDRVNLITELVTKWCHTKVNNMIGTSITYGIEFCWI